MAEGLLSFTSFLYTLMPPVPLHLAHAGFVKEIHGVCVCVYKHTVHS